MTTPNITVTVDTSNDTYEFTTDPYVKPPDEALPVDRLGDVTFKAGGSNSNITVVATIPSSATAKDPFDPALQAITTTTETYQVTALGKVTLTVPTYNGRSLTGDPLTIAPTVALELSTSNPATQPISFGAQVTLTVAGATGATDVYFPAGLFVDQTSPVSVDQGGTTYTIDDVNDGVYDLSTEAPASNSKLTPLVAQINVSSTKKPHL